MYFMLTMVLFGWRGQVWVVFMIVGETLYFHAATPRICCFFLFVRFYFFEFVE